MESNKGKEHLGDRIKKIRKSLGLNLADFSAKVGSSATAFSEIENDKYKPGFEIMLRLATVYKANLYYLYLGKGEMFLDTGSDLTSKLTMGDQDLTKYDLEFIKYFTKSEIFRLRILAAFKQLLLEDRELFDREIEERDEID